MTTTIQEASHNPQLTPKDNTYSQLSIPRHGHSETADLSILCLGIEHKISLPSNVCVCVSDCLFLPLYLFVCVIPCLCPVLCLPVLHFKAFLCASTDKARVQQAASELQLHGVPVVVAPLPTDHFQSLHHQ